MREHTKRGVDEHEAVSVLGVGSDGQGGQRLELACESSSNSVCVHKMDLTIEYGEKV